MKINNWSKKYKSYANAVGAPTSNNTENRSQNEQLISKQVPPSNQQSNKMILLLQGVNNQVKMLTSLLITIYY